MSSAVAIEWLLIAKAIPKSSNANVVYRGSVDRGSVDRGSVDRGSVDRGPDARLSDRVRLLRSEVHYGLVV